MIPEDRDALNVLAGEYVLGLLDPAEAREIEAARASNAALRSAIDFWQQRLHPLAALAPPAEPPSDLWSGIAARLDSVPQTGAARWWNRTSPWRWATAGMAALAVALLLYIALSPRSIRRPAAPSSFGRLRLAQRRRKRLASFRRMACCDWARCPPMCGPGRDWRSPSNRPAARRPSGRRGPWCSSAT